MRPLCDSARWHPMNYYHVMNKEGVWHVYRDHSGRPMTSGATKAEVMKRARVLARQTGGKVIVHKVNETTK